MSVGTKINLLNLALRVIIGTITYIDNVWYHIPRIYNISHASEELILLILDLFISYPVTKSLLESHQGIVCHMLYLHRIIFLKS